MNRVRKKCSHANCPERVPVVIFLYFSNPNNNKDKKPHITVPYHQGLSESFKRTCKKYGIEVHLKGGPTIKNLLMTPKDKDPILKRSRVTYRFKCNRVECNEEYIGESARNFGERFKEHLKSPSPIHDHINISGHTVSIEDFSILAKGRPKPPQYN